MPENYLASSLAIGIIGSNRCRKSVRTDLSGIFGLAMCQEGVFVFFCFLMGSSIMADEYYSLEDVVAKLGKSAEEVTEMIQAGKLREFRDGEKLLFNSEEVDGLVDKDQVDLSTTDDVMETVQTPAGDEVELLSDDDSLMETPIDQADDSIGIDDSLPGELPGGSIGVSCRLVGWAGIYR